MGIHLLAMPACCHQDSVMHKRLVCCLQQMGSKWWLPAVSCAQGLHGLHFPVFFWLHSPGFRTVICMLATAERWCCILQAERARSAKI